MKPDEKLFDIAVQINDLALLKGLYAGVEIMPEQPVETLRNGVPPTHQY